jgi:hypothetical protein
MDKTKPIPKKQLGAIVKPRSKRKQAMMMSCAILAGASAVTIGAGALPSGMPGSPVAAHAGEWKNYGYAFNRWETGELARWTPGSVQPGQYLAHIANFPVLGGRRGAPTPTCTT